MEKLKEFEGVRGGRQAAGYLEENARRRGRIGEEEVNELGCVPFTVGDFKKLHGSLYDGVVVLLS